MPKAMPKDLRLLYIANDLEALANEVAAVAGRVDSPRLRVHLSRSVQDFRGAARNLRAQVIPAVPSDIVGIP